MNSNGISIPNLREYFAERGRKTGLITTCDVTDATPAAFGAHTLSRTNNADIAAQYIDRNIDIIMGGGSSRFPLGEGGLRNVATQQGYSVITIKSQLMETTATKILALFSGSHLPYEADRNKTTIPSLEEMTVKSINILKQNSQGFFLMVEGGRIDHAGHLPNSDQTKKQKNIDETLAFDKAVKAALDFAASDGNTLVLVTADHETGDLQKNGATYEFNSNAYTGVDVPVFAYGVGASYFTGSMVNTDLSAKIKQLAVTGGIGPPPISSTTSSTTSTAASSTKSTTISSTKSGTASSTKSNIASAHTGSGTSVSTDSFMSVSTGSGLLSTASGTSAGTEPGSSTSISPGISSITDSGTTPEPSANVLAVVVIVIISGLGCGIIFVVIYILKKRKV